MMHTDHTFELFNTTFYCILQVTATVMVCKLEVFFNISVHVGKNQLIAVQDKIGTIV